MLNLVFLLTLSLSELFITWPYPQMPAETGKKDKHRGNPRGNPQPKYHFSSSVGMIPQENKESPQFLWFR